jgi:copper resistance protein B
MKTARRWLVLGALFVLATKASFAQEAHDHAQHTEEHRPPSAVSHPPPKHIPPDPPAHPMGDMSNERMIELMGMDDTAVFTMIMLDQLEWRRIDEGDALAWDAQAWIGGDYNKASLKSEGSRVGGEHESSNELLWDRIVTRWWSFQAGMRHDVLEGPSRTWAAFGVQGLAPHWWEVDATFYVGEEGRTALGLSAEVDLLLTQRLKLQPELEVSVYGKEDAANAIGSGLSSTGVGLRLRYEIAREFAPYVGAVWKRLYGGTSDLARAQGRDPNEVQFVAGVKVWF